MHKLLLKVGRRKNPQLGGNGNLFFTGSYKYFLLTYLATLLLSFHYYSVTYINSTYLSQYISPKNVSILYTFGAILNICLFLGVIRFSKKWGNYKIMLFFLALEGVLLVLLGLLRDIAWITPVFILHDALNPLLLLCLDIFLEHRSNDATTGTTRGAFMTFISLPAFISPVIVGALINQGKFSYIYFISAAFIFFLFFLILFQFKQYNERELKAKFSFSIIIRFFENIHIRNIFISNILLQTFYSWMIVYVPIYLLHYIGFGWDKIGLIISVSILPFIFFELPLGVLADRKLGEKEILLVGFLLIFFGMIFLGLGASTSIVLWIAILFLARTGACFVEIACETYFFKQINETNDDLVSFWRMANPIGFILGTTLGSAALVILPYNQIFYVFAVLIALGFANALQLKDTK